MNNQKNNSSKPGHSGIQSWCSTNPQLQKNHCSTRHLKVSPAHVSHYQSRHHVPTSQQWHVQVLKFNQYAYSWVSLVCVTDAVK